MLETVLLVAGGVVGGLILALKVIAPRTATKRDDQALELLEKAYQYLPHADQKVAAKLLAAKV